MLGLGEDEKEVMQVCQDLRAVGCDFLSLGQYLAPNLKAYPVKAYIHPDKFEAYKRDALSLGFLYVASGPYVRSSYLAEEYLKCKHLMSSSSEADQGVIQRLYVWPNWGQEWLL